MYIYMYIYMHVYTYGSHGRGGEVCTESFEVKPFLIYIYIIYIYIYRSHGRRGEVCTESFEVEPFLSRIVVAVGADGHSLGSKDEPVEDKRPVCQLSSKRLEDDWHSGLLSSTKHRLSGRRSHDCRRVDNWHSGFCSLQNLRRDRHVGQ